jgi:hypothetical protein
MLLLMLWSLIRCPLLRHQLSGCSESGSSLEAMISQCMSRWCLVLLCSRWSLPCWSRWSPGLTPIDKILLWYEGLLDDIMQGLRHQNPNLFMQAIVKAEHELVDFKFLSVKLRRIPEQLHKMGSVLGNHTTSL